MEIQTRNTNTLCSPLYRAIAEQGIPESSRNGPVLRFPTPLTIVIERPWERVNFSPDRDANPFFHFVESMAMLGNVNCIPMLAWFVAKMKDFSDNGETQNAFYGSRARGSKWDPMGIYELDQLEQVILELREKPNSRQAVIDLWRVSDLVSAAKDKACNVMMVFSINPDGTVRMTTFNRSNDMIWGHGSGANVVHFSYFHEYVALSLGRKMGAWYHVSNNAHVYTANPQWAKVLNASQWPDFYQVDTSQLTTAEFDRIGDGLVPLWEPDEDRQDWLNELNQFLTLTKHRAGILLPGFDMIVDFKCRLLKNTAMPMLNAWTEWKKGNKQQALRYATEIEARDWRVACLGWMGRRYNSQAGHSSP